MSNDLDESLRAALRPVDPGEDLTRKVLAAVEQDSSRPPRGPLPPPGHPGWRWPSAVLAIALLVGLATAYHWQLRRQERGLEARRQLIEALQVTSEKLDLAYRVVNEQEHTENGS
ncbi:MAG TPA: hypothetical protein VGL55_17410 [Steroidobacteraceae bacterium]|jgi:hypothetical protein